MFTILARFGGRRGRQGGRAIESAKLQLFDAYEYCVDYRFFEYLSHGLLLQYKIGFTYIDKEYVRILMTPQGAVAEFRGPLYCPLH